MYNEGQKNLFMLKVIDIFFFFSFCSPFKITMELFIEFEFGPLKSIFRNFIATALFSLGIAKNARVHSPLSR